MRTAIRDYLSPLLTTLLLGVVAYDHFVAPRAVGPVPAAVDGTKLGRIYGPTLAPALADGWVAAAATLEAGKTVSEAQDALQTAFKAARVKQFTDKVAPEFARVLAEGTEPRDASARAEIVKLWRDFAAGLRGGRQ